MTETRMAKGCAGRPGAPVMAGLAIMMGTTLLLMGCSSRPDSGEIEAVQAEIDRARQAEAEVWAPDELRAAEEALSGALNAISAQEGKWFKSYDGARDLLSRAREEAGNAAEAAIAGKARARDDAEATIAAAEGVLGEARSRLDAAPAGRVSRADRAMFRDELEALPQQLEDARARLAEGKIKESLAGATAAESAAASLRDRIDESLQRRIELPPK